MELKLTQMELFVLFNLYISVGKNASKSLIISKKQVKINQVLFVLFNLCPIFLTLQTFQQLTNHVNHFRHIFSQNTVSSVPFHVCRYLRTRIAQKQLKILINFVEKHCPFIRRFYSLRRTVHARIYYFLAAYALRSV